LLQRRHIVRSFGCHLLCESSSGGVKVSRIAQLLLKTSLLGSVLKLAVTWILYHSNECMQIPPACVALRLQFSRKRGAVHTEAANLQHSDAHNVHKIRTHPLYWISNSYSWKRVNNCELKRAAFSFRSPARLRVALSIGS
jgi:hypothetical protein